LRNKHQMLSKSNKHVRIATADSINSYLQDLLLANQKQGKNVAKLSTTIKKLQDRVTRDPQSRDLVARKLHLLRSSMMKSQKLQDVDSVYIAPSVDDLDNYLQGVLTEVDRVEIPELDEEEKSVPMQLKLQRSSKVLPSQQSIRLSVSSLLQHVKSPAKVSHSRRIASELLAIVDAHPEARDLIAEKLSSYQQRLQLRAQQKLTDADSTHLPPDADDLDNFLQSVIDELDRQQVPQLDTGDADKKEGKKERKEMLLPIEFSDRFNQARARSHGEFVDKNEWEKHPFDDVGNDRVSNKDEDRMASSSSSLVHGESKVREDGHINDPYGFQGSAHAEIPVSSANSPDTKNGGLPDGFHLGVGAATSGSLDKGSKLCGLVNCYSREAIPLPPAAIARRESLRQTVSSQQAAELKRAQVNSQAARKGSAGAKAWGLPLPL